MIDALAQSLAQSLARRSARERLLLAVLVGAVVPLAFVFLVALPLLERREVAGVALADAQATRAWYSARQADVATLPARTAPPRQTGAPIGLGGLEASLIDAGLRDAVALLANAQGAAVSLTLNAVPFEAVMGWIDTVEADAGYRLAALRLEQGEPGFVSAEIRLEPEQ